VKPRRHSRQKEEKVEDKKIQKTRSELMAHAYNPSYSGGKDQEDGGSKPVPGKQFGRPYLQKNANRVGRVVQVVEHLPSKHEIPSSTPQYHTHKKICQRSGQEPRQCRTL
jgi:hypothetical protein